MFDFVFQTFPSVMELKEVRKLVLKNPIFKYVKEGRNSFDQESSAEWYSPTKKLLADHTEQLMSALSAAVWPVLDV